VGLISEASNSKSIEEVRDMKKHRLLVLWVVVALLAFTGSVQAQWANPALLMTAEQVEQNISKPDWVVVDCRKLEEYAKGHIPGAISFGKNCKSALRDATSRVFASASKYDSLIGKAGIGNNTHVVFYGEVKSKTMDDASVAFWIFEYLGHTDKAHVLNGGLEAWKKGDRKLDTEPTIKPAASFKSAMTKNRIATTEEVLKIAKGQVKGVQLIDSRNKKEYAGEDIRAVRGGRIPNCTLNVPHEDTYDQVKDPATGKDKSTGVLSYERVAKAYEKLDKNKRTIAYCQTGSRSTLTYMEMRMLGFKDPANYDDSWIIYGANEKFPVEEEQRIDLARIKSLEDDVKKLKEQLKKEEEN
jgi:thiosulfate/3-mercaptopyruvate sulfurtransferase